MAEHYLIRRKQAIVVLVYVVIDIKIINISLS